MGKDKDKKKHHNHDDEVYSQPDGHERSRPRVKKVVLAYSGGLDTSVIVPWLKNNYGCDVICMCANLGQEEELDGLEAKALTSGASKCYIEDLREDFISQYIFPALRAGA